MSLKIFLDSNNDTSWAVTEDTQSSTTTNATQITSSSITNLSTEDSTITFTTLENGTFHLIAFLRNTYYHLGPTLFLKYFN